MMNQSKNNKRFLKCFLGLVLVVFLILMHASVTIAQWPPFTGGYGYPGGIYTGYSRYGYPGSSWGRYPGYGYPYGGYGDYSIPYGYAVHPRYSYPGSFYGGYTGYGDPGSFYSGYSMYVSPNGILIPHEIFKLLASSNYDTAQLGAALFQEAIMGAWTPWLSPSQIFYKYGGPVL